MSSAIAARHCSALASLRSVSRNREAVPVAYSTRRRLQHFSHDGMAEQRHVPVAYSTRRRLQPALSLFKAVIR